MRSRVVKWVALAALFCCCGTHPKVALDPEFTSPRANEQSAVHAADSEIERTIAEIATLRGWAPKLSIGVRVATDDAIAAAMLGEARAQMTADVQEAQSLFVAAFGWVPFGFDIERDVLGRLASDVSGLYCVTSGRILLSEHSAPSLVRKTLRHELVHAFQDAEYGLGSRIRWQTDRGDYIAAIHSLAEGEATCIELALDDPLHRGCLDPLIAESFDRFGNQGSDSLPGVIRRSLASPYVDGGHYVARLLREGGWPALEHAWKGGLQSTRQLRRNNVQRTVLLPIAPPQYEFGDCALLYLDSIGEQGLRSLVWDAADSTDLQQVLESLVGERVAVWRCNNRCVAVMRLRFEQASAARTFGKWLAGSVGLSPTQGSATCSSFRQRAASYYARGQEIAIASVLPCHGHIEAKWADTCPLVARLANRLAEL